MTDLELLTALHSRIGIGYCPVCHHYGSDCTGDDIGIAKPPPTMDEVAQFLADRIASQFRDPSGMWCQTQLDQDIRVAAHSHRLDRASLDQAVALRLAQAFAKYDRDNA